MKKRTTKRYRVIGTLAGLTLGVLLWGVLAIYLIVSIDFDSFWSSVTNVAESKGLSYLIFGLVVPVLFLGLLGFAVGQAVHELKKRIKLGISVISGSIAVFIMITFLMINRVFIKAFVGNEIVLLPIENRLVRNVLLLAIAFVVGYLTGKIIEENKK